MTRLYYDGVPRPSDGMVYAAKGFVASKNDGDIAKGRESGLCTTVGLMWLSHQKRDYGECKRYSSQCQWVRVCIFDYHRLLCASIEQADSVSHYLITGEWNTIKTINLQACCLHTSTALPRTKSLFPPPPICISSAPFFPIPLPNSRKDKLTVLNPEPPARLLVLAQFIITSIEVTLPPVLHRTTH